MNRTLVVILVLIVVFSFIKHRLKWFNQTYLSILRYMKFLILFSIQCVPFPFSNSNYNPKAILNYLKCNIQEKKKFRIQIFLKLSTDVNIIKTLNLLSRKRFKNTKLFKKNAIKNK